MTRFTLSLVAAAVVCLGFISTQEATAQITIGIGGGTITIGGPGGGKPVYPRPQPVRYEYTVTEYNPFTGGVYGTPRRFTDRNAAESYRNSLARAHWVKWRFVGFNQQLRWRRFSSSSAAQTFLRNDGPQKSSKTGFAILTKETRVVASRVGMTTRQL